MVKHLLALLLSLGLTVSIIGCSSSDDEGAAETTEQAAAGDDFGGEAFADDEFADDGFAEEGGDEFADDGFADEGGDEFAQDEFAEDEFAQDEFAEDEFAEDEFGATEDEFAQDEFAQDEFAQDEFAMEDPVVDTAEEPMAGMGTDEFAEPVVEPETVEVAEPEPFEEFTDPMAPMPEIASTDGFGDDPNAALGLVPVKKMKTTPYRIRGTLVNAIYIARPGDDINSISQKIYNSDRTEDILNASPWLRNGIKVGDKVYYNSPQRPNDESQLLTFYEDLGLSPQTYVSKAGDNIRVVAKDLLGHDRSWMEIYATNLDVETKAELMEGTTLRYWPENVASTGTQTMAMNDAPAPPPEEPMMDEEMPPPPPAPDQAANDMAQALERAQGTAR